MPKIYRPVIHFKDGKSWSPADLGLEWTANHIPVTLEQLEKSDNVELTSMLTGETRKVTEIKSIEILF
ncbi:hypothetical protein [Heyndrickxia oleronia]|uniref:hypothetical protein n=1 Tax=Heyndrickxia oleronia TaxID=38875 RepID=UPI001C0EF1D3|nr:hypothetical protein [Heyndrickxia oleronia]MBU5214369.1 hypothetical protein [Heyndrickxia oleronia]